MPWIETGASARAPFRKLFDSEGGALRDINQFKSYSNVYHSIYWFREIEEKFDFLTGKNHIGANYETAIIDRVVLDLDAFIKSKSQGKSFESYTHKALEDIRKLEEWAEQKDLLRQYRFSGGGFYFIFSAVGHALKLRDFELNLRNELDVDIDVSTIGDSSRMMRVTNSYNFKKYRECFCIPLKQEEIHLEYNEIKELAKQPRYKKRYIYGRSSHDFTDCKIDREKIKLKRLKIDLSQAKTIDANEILAKYGWEINDFCDTIKGIIGLGHVGNSLRIELIKYLKTIVKLSFPDCVKIMVALLGAEGVHSAIEMQAKYAYRGHWIFNPTKLKALGYCEWDCNKCLNYRNLFFKM